MSLVIQIRDGQPHEHPILIENFITAFPHLDLNNLPPTFAKFERIPRPIEGPYEELINVSYQWVGDVVKDVWEMRQFTEQEKIDKQNFVKAKFAELFPNILSWTFDETRCGFVCPVSYPTDSEIYVWQEDTQRWTHITDLPSLANRTPEDPPIIVGRDFVTF
jgi:hypothetical protein